MVQYEIEGYHWKKDQCKMHDVVIYFKKDGTLHCILLCIISDDREHDTCLVHDMQRIVMCLGEGKFAPN